MRLNGRFAIAAVILLLVFGASLSLLSFLPTAVSGTQNVVLLDTAFRLMPQENYRQGLGSFRGNENLTLAVTKTETAPVNFTLTTPS